ncbi:DUF4352 domain-containing protein [Candidatus Bathyarchaeota archaeon]|nr:MAG: DUF4352 domain-containing protein [Candidatus Bathyarchaeota archaeon]
MSPVIATVILVAVAITVAVSVAFWMGGITGQYTRFEKLQVQDPLTTHEANGNWTLIFIVKNVGSTDATVDSVFINGKTPSQWPSSSIVANITSSGVTISSGNQAAIKVSIDDDNSGLSSGTAIEVKFRTASGYEYPKMVTLP